MADVERLEIATSSIRALDYRYGGGRCRTAVATVVAQAEPLLGAAASDPVLARLCTALADLHNLAGWVCFDTGSTTVARTHFNRALTLAAQAGNDDLITNICYRAGRMHLHRDAPRDALGVFRLGQHVAHACGSALASAILHVNQAWAHAKLGLADQAHALLGMAEDAFARTNSHAAPPWAAFFSPVDLTAMAGTVHTDLARVVDPSHAVTAIPLLESSIDGYGPDMARSRAFNLISLAVNHVLDGDLDHAATVGARAVAACGDLTSTRVRDRLRPLRELVETRKSDPNARELADRIDELPSMGE
ncbi:MAG TPA: tetratricopeptide repeat protein [Pseudonocardiaceae bacterium]|nr:tetratricopeptide repeat protein [Pseudonocardiaceae bacterium]